MVGCRYGVCVHRHEELRDLNDSRVGGRGCRVDGLDEINRRYEGFARGLAENDIAQLELDMSPGLEFKCPGCVRRAGLRLRTMQVSPSTGPSTKMPVRSGAAGVAGLVVVGLVVVRVRCRVIRVRRGERVIGPAFVTGGERELSRIKNTKQRKLTHIQILELILVICVLQ